MMRRVALAALLRVAWPAAGAAQGFAQEGVASYYASWHHGRRTASGALFDMHAMTAAHRSLAFGRRVLVLDLDTGRVVRVTINDRGPYVAGRVIDLSLGAARLLGIEQRGLARVRITAEGW